MMDGKPTALELLEPAAPETLVPRFGLWPWFLAAAILVMVVVALAIYLKKRRPAAADIVSLRKAALDEALAVLAGPAPETTREAAVTSSLVLRKYLAAAANDPALFETHEEFVSRRDSLQALTPAARTAAEDGFSRLASLKYAPEILEAAPAQVIAESRALLETLHHGFAA